VYIVALHFLGFIHFT